MSSDDTTVLKDPKNCTNYELVLACFTEEVLEAAIARLREADFPSWELLHTRATNWEFHPFNRFLEVPENEVSPSDFDLMVKLFPDFEEMALRFQIDHPDYWALMLVRAAQGHLANKLLAQECLAGPLGFEAEAAIRNKISSSHGFAVFSCWAGPI